MPVSKFKMAAAVILEKDKPIHPLLRNGYRCEPKKLENWFADKRYLSRPRLTRRHIEFSLKGRISRTV